MIHRDQMRLLYFPMDSPEATSYVAFHHELVSQYELLRGYHTNIMLRIVYLMMKHVYSMEFYILPLVPNHVPNVKRDQTYKVECSLEQLLCANWCCRDCWLRIMKAVHSRPFFVPLWRQHRCSSVTSTGVPMPTIFLLTRRGS